MKVTKPTIKNIARAAGVSTATVSRALAYKNNLKPATAKRIRQIAQEMGYHKNVAASQLASNMTNTIAVIINYTQTDFWIGILNGILHRARELNHQVITFYAGDNDSQRLTQTVNEALEHQANGILLISGKLEQEQTAILSTAHTPYRLISIYDPEHPEHRYVSSNNVEIGERATNYLIQHGHHKIGLIGIDHSSTGQQRLFGYQRAMTMAGLPINPHWIHYGNYSYQDGKRLFSAVQDSGVTAVVAGSDMIGAGLINSATQAGWQLPDQLSIVSIDGSDACELTTPALTTVKQDFYQMGLASVDNLLQDQPATFIPTTIIERDSVQTVPAK
ncbi:LacI family DNA-binding transcriptional regulator [Limosilactobacillus antri]|uniref:LacI family DNA-binding transcriptional regulator n=1 Tax=Limosilactobacillus antri TaxID=227943 RepID=UPI001F58CC3A|nr:LacI family DNA-binding transcriptional regulator [Limosilactobacillus antri]